MGLIYQSRERFDEAKSLWSECVSRGWEYSVLYRNLGTILAAKSNEATAIALFERDPATALSDAAQQLNFEEFKHFLTEVKQLGMI